jgi:IS30 family transposase
MARHRRITADLGAPVYFCDAHAPRQRGSNENSNGLLRLYFSKGTDLSIYSPQHLLAGEDGINNRPCSSLKTAHHPALRTVASLIRAVPVATLTGNHPGLTKS